MTKALAASLLEILDEIRIAQVGFEGDEDVVTVNGKMAGGTISRRSLEIDRWWPGVKQEIAEYLANRILSSQRVELRDAVPGVEWVQTPSGLQPVLSHIQADEPCANS